MVGSNLSLKSEKECRYVTSGYQCKLNPNRMPSQMISGRCLNVMPVTFRLDISKELRCD